MEGYLGEFDIDIASSPFAKYTQADWAIHWIGYYGQFDGGHHKQWALDQVSRILHGTKVKVVQARWENGTKEYRYSLEDPTPEYHAWVKEMRGEYDEENEEYEYGYDEGIAP